MDSKSQNAQIFNHELRSLKRLRATRRYQLGKGDAFLLRRAGEIASEKISDINRKFDRMLVIGLPSFFDGFFENLPTDKKPTDFVHCNHWPENIDGDYDMILSGLVLQSRNDVPDLVRSARQRLNPDGFFLSAILGGESLLNLRRACFALDQSRYGGVLPRLAPMIDIQQAAGLLAMAGLAQPVIDRDNIRVNYRTLSTLVSDLRDVGETNSLMSRQTAYEGRDFLKNLETVYPEKTSDGKFCVLFDLIWMSGWAPHESQQKPLKPGSAKTRLSDALRKIKEG